MRTLLPAFRRDCILVHRRADLSESCANISHLTQVHLRLLSAGALPKDDREYADN
jgi:hypothetical protein